MSQVIRWSNRTGADGLIYKTGGMFTRAALINTLVHAKKRNPPVSLSRRLPLDEHLMVLRLLCPDLGVFAVSLVTVILCNKLVKNRETVSAANITSVSQLLLGYCLASGWLVLVSGWLMLNADEGRSQKVPLHCSTLPIWSLWKRNGMEASPQRARESPSAKNHL